MLTVNEVNELRSVLEKLSGFVKANSPVDLNQLPLRLPVEYADYYEAARSAERFGRQLSNLTVH